MTDLKPIQGELQSQIMPVLWRFGEATTEQVRAALPPRYRSAYTTIQTVLNRLAERGLLSREQRGNAIAYRPRISESQYLSRAIDRTLSGASAEARQAVLAELVGRLDSDELEQLRQLARRVGVKRGASGS